MTPRVISSIPAMREAASDARRNGSLALVPTMGALHEGHLSLVRAALEQCDTVVVSIFVNPTQFAPNEDFARYPRTLDADIKMLAHEGVAFVFAPSVEEMYPPGYSGTFIDVPGLTDRLDGASRPGHFRGVATVVTKLLNITSPDVAFFGQKDAAQVAVLRAIIHDLNLSVKLVVCPTAREPDGLAMSSRNRYLSAEQHTRSLVLHRALSAAAHRAEKGEQDGHIIRECLLTELATEPAVEVEYAEVVDPKSLLRVENVSPGTLVAVAVRLGATRLIDNMLMPAVAEYACE